RSRAWSAPGRTGSIRQRRDLAFRGSWPALLHGLLGHAEHRADLPIRVPGAAQAGDHDGPDIVEFALDEPEMLQPIGVLLGQSLAHSAELTDESADGVFHATVHGTGP